jgi:hypothetical protein
MLKKVTTALALLGAAGLPAVAGAQALEQTPNAMAVVRDANTGKLRAPTADELQSLNNGNGNGNGNGRSIAVRADAAPTQQKFHPTGAQGLRLTDAFMSSEVATRGADGKITMQCLESGHADMAPHAAHTTIQPVTE